MARPETKTIQQMRDYIHGAETAKGKLKRAQQQHKQQ